MQDKSLDKTQPAKQARKLIEQSLARPYFNHNHNSFTNKNKHKKNK